MGHRRQVLAVSAARSQPRRRDRGRLLEVEGVHAGVQAMGIKISRASGRELATKGTQRRAHACTTCRDNRGLIVYYVCPVGGDVLIRQCVRCGGLYEKFGKQKRLVGYDSMISCRNRR